jgi:hypothetical protein
MAVKHSNKKCSDLMLIPEEDLCVVLMCSVAPGFIEFTGAALFF